MRPANPTGRVWRKATRNAAKMSRRKTPSLTRSVSPAPTVEQTEHLCAINDALALLGFAPVTLAA